MFILKLCLDPSFYGKSRKTLVFKLLNQFNRDTLWLYSINLNNYQFTSKTNFTSFIHSSFEFNDLVFQKLLLEGFLWLWCQFVEYGLQNRAAPTNHDISYSRLVAIGVRNVVEFILEIFPICFLEPLQRDLYKLPSLLVFEILHHIRRSWHASNSLSLNSAFYRRACWLAGLSQNSIIYFVVFVCGICSLHLYLNELKPIINYNLP